MDFSVLPDLVPRIIVLALLLCGAGFFSGSETALFSLTRVQRERLGRSPSATDRYVVALLRDPRRLILTLTIWNVLVNVTFAVLAASIVMRLLPRAGEVVLALATTGVSVPLLLLLGEITPKSIALRTAERWAALVARPLGAFAVLAAPIRIVVGAAGSVMARVFGGGPGALQPTAIGEAEFKALVDAGSEEGSLEASERRLIHNVFAFRDRSVAEIMTSTRKMFSLSFDLPLQRLLAEVSRSGYSRIPIHRGRKEEVIGIIFAKDLVGASSGRLAGRTVKDLLRPPMYVPKTTKCDRLFREFQRKRTHLALVVDEYGRLVGLVTMEDILVELFGASRDEKERGKAAAAAPAGDGVVSAPIKGESGPMPPAPVGPAPGGGGPT